MSDDFRTMCGGLFHEIGNHMHMVLSTSLGDHVSARMMSIILEDGRFYFQTDRTMRKYRQLVGNPRVALCINNLQVEGLCEELGRPVDHELFRRRFASCFPGSFTAYSGLSDERLFAVSPTFIQRWIYEDGIPYVERFDFMAQEYEKKPYAGR